MSKEECIGSITEWGQVSYEKAESILDEYIQSHLSRIAQLETENQYLKDLLQVSVECINKVSEKLDLPPMTLKVDRINEIEK